MKKNLINTVAFLLCGAMFFGSCEDMLDAESNRVEYEFDNWTFNDSVYSVLGILNAVQQVGDRQVLLGELRGDLVSINENTLDDIKDISNFDFDAESNQYLAAKDYYAIINNCNVFLSRVDTNLTYDNQRLMLREYVAVKSVRAWTYMQLMKNHGHIPFFTEPVLTNGKAEEIMARTPADQLTVINFLINDIAPYENPAAYPMPKWQIPGFATAGMTAKLFMPIRVLLGDLYLWRASLRAEMTSYPLPFGNPNSDYALAAKCYTQYLTEDNKMNDATDVASHKKEKPDEDLTYYPSTGFAGRFLQSSFTNKINNFVAAIRYASTENVGSVSKLADIFAPVGAIGKKQLEASPAIRAISDRQTYLLRTGNENKYYYDIVNSKKFPGDQRIYSVVASQRGDDLNKTRYDNVIIKFNYDEANSLRFDGNTMLFTPKKPTTDIFLDRPEYVYLRLAEAFLGLEREGYTGAMELAMTVLKSGIKGECNLYWNPDTIDEYQLDADEEPIMAPMVDKDGDPVVLVKVENELDEEGNPVLDLNGDPVLIETEIPQYAPVVMAKVLSDYDAMLFDFSDKSFVNNNKGIHSRGSGFCEANNAYSLSDSCVAAHFGILPAEEKATIKVRLTNEDGSFTQWPVVKKDADGNDLYIEYVNAAGKTEKLPDYELDAEGNVTWEFAYEEKEVEVYTITDEQRLEYMYDKLIDEMALEMAFEGHRFGDLSRLATALANPEFLARRVAARNVATGDWRTAEGAEGWDGALFTRLLDKNNWYMPLPGNYLKPGITPADPAEPFIPTPDDEEEEGGENGDDTTDGTEGGDDTTGGETVNP